MLSTMRGTRSCARLTLWRPGGYYSLMLAARASSSRERRRCVAESAVGVEVVEQASGPSSAMLQADLNTGRRQPGTTLSSRVNLIAWASSRGAWRVATLAPQRAQRAPYSSCCPRLCMLDRPPHQLPSQALNLVHIAKNNQPHPLGQSSTSPLHARRPRLSLTA